MNSLLEATVLLQVPSVQLCSSNSYLEFAAYLIGGHLRLNE